MKTRLCLNKDARKLIENFLKECYKEEENVKEKVSRACKRTVIEECFENKKEKLFLTANSSVKLRIEFSNSE